MALVGPDTRCAICGEGLFRAFTATSGMFFPPGHRLERYCDAPLHLDCLSSWPHRGEFSRQHFLSALESHWLHAHPIIHATPAWCLLCGPPGFGGIARYAKVVLSEWPFRLYSQCENWSEFVDGDYQDGLDGAALDAADAVMLEVRELVPTREALAARRAAIEAGPATPRTLVTFGVYLAAFWPEAAASVDWSEREELRLAMEHTRVERARVRAEAIARSNEIARQLAVKLMSDGALTCPHCGRRTYAMRFIDVGPKEKSHFICKLCSRSFAGDEYVGER